MMMNENDSIEMTAGNLVVRFSEGEKQETMIRYVQNAPLREAVRQLVNCAVDTYVLELFHDVCGRCGSCCRGRSVPVTALEIERIALHSGYFCIDDFRAEYIDPSFTWNEGDGLIKPVDGRCAFLEQGPSGRFSCRIYSVRPSRCAFSILPDMRICRKERGKLIYHLSAIRLEEGKIKICTRSGLSLEKVPANPILIEKIDFLREILARIERPPESIDAMIIEAEKKLDELRFEFLKEKDSASLLRKVAELLQFAANIEQKDVQRREPVDRLCGKIERLLNLAGNRKASEAPLEKKAGKIVIEAMRLLPETMFVIAKEADKSFHLRLDFSENDEVRRMAKVMIQEVMKVEDERITDALWHQDPQCFLCGECCRHYKVEITPYDVDRLAEHFGISEEEMGRRYLHPGIFSWNEKNAILAKKDNSKLDSEESVADCAFLEEKAPNVHMCAIYEARPEVCRGYTLEEKRCREMSRALKPQSHISNILYIDIIRDELTMFTGNMYRNQTPPVSQSLHEHLRIGELCSSMKSEVMRIILERKLENEKEKGASLSGLRKRR